MNINNVVKNLRGLLVQNRDYSSLLEVPYVDGLTFAIENLPDSIRKTLVDSSPTCTTVRVTMFIRKSQEFLMFHPIEGDGFPLCTLRIGDTQL